MFFFMGICFLGFFNNIKFIFKKNAHVTKKKWSRKLYIFRCGLN
jgi:hypothetical protein